MTDHIPSIAILDDYYNRAHGYADWQQTTFAHFDFYTAPIADPAQLVDTLLPYSAVGLMRERTPFPATLIEQLPNLELIVTTGMKNASIDVAAAGKNDVLVCGTESPGHATAELALLLMMSLVRRFVPLTNALTQQGEWQPEIGGDLRGRTLGIVGLGRLGRQLARFATALGMNVIAWSENLTEEMCNTEGVGYATREQLFKQADIVSIHLRHSARTHQMITSDDLVQLGAKGYIVNTSRAEIINLDDLRTALDTNIIAGAGVDVFPSEPISNDNWMVSHPKVLATPHIGYCTDETFKTFYPQMLDAFEAYFQGKPIRILKPV